MGPISGAGVAAGPIPGVVLAAGPFRAVGAAAGPIEGLGVALGPVTAVSLTLGPSQELECLQCLLQCLEWLWTGYMPVLEEKGVVKEKGRGKKW